MKNSRIFSFSIEQIRASTQALKLVKNFYLFYKKWLKVNDYYEFELLINQLPAKAQFWGLTNSGNWHWLLAWHPLIFDSQVFGYSIGKFCLLLHCRYWPDIQAREEGRRFLLEVISEAAKKGLKGLWARVPVQDLLSVQVLEKVGFLLYDSSVEWEIDLALLPDYSFPHLAVKVRPWQKNDRKAVLKLASQAFCQLEDYADRFALDPFLRDGCSNLYRRWMANSLSGEQADQVLVLEYAGYVEGVITLKKTFMEQSFRNSCCGWVVLNAISPILRGKGYYYVLLWAGLNWLRTHGSRLARVRTKASQWAVIRTWTQLGARPVGSDLTFHYWINNL